MEKLRRREAAKKLTAALEILKDSIKEAIELGLELYLSGDQWSVRFDATPINLRIKMFYTEKLL